MLPASGARFNQSRFTTRSAGPVSPSTTFSLSLAATFSRTSNSQSRMSVGLPSSSLAVLACEVTSVSPAEIIGLGLVMGIWATAL